MDKTWKTNVPAQKLLNVRFTTGKYNNESKPKVIWESHPEFQKFKLATFRTHLNKTKARVGANLYLIKFKHLVSIFYLLYYSI